MTKQDCIGCEDDFYNDSITKECWSFSTGKLIFRKKVAIHQRPPWKQTAHLFPNCYRQKGYIFVNGDREY